MSVFEQLLDTEIYAWVSKKWASKRGLIDTIGTIDNPVPTISLENAYRIWHTKANVEGVELFMGLGRIYLSFVSNPFLIHNHNMIMKFGIWIKVPDDKKKYLKNLEIRNLVRPSESKNHKRKNSDVHWDSLTNRNKTDVDSLHHDKKPMISGSSHHIGKTIHDESDDGDDNKDDSDKDDSSEPRKMGKDEDLHVMRSSYKGDIDLLIPRNLKELLEITEADSYVQLGDLYFERSYSNNSSMHSNHTNNCYRF